MAKYIKYAVFNTDWGWFGIAVSENGLIRTVLPAADPDKIRISLLKGLEPAEEYTGLLLPVQKLIKRYYEGLPVDFPVNIKIDLNGFTQFSRRILSACRKIKYSQTITYSGLAGLAGSPKAARAAGGVLSENPVPLIIPCHRVIRSDGSMGGFSAGSGIRTKSKMAALEAGCSKNRQG